ncbi:hypothetical protein HER10_EVM0008485 [Colletotrichum scovillei]|uniref:Altered inheritance of mitochondria protein 19 n=2 Tax=Colletotrichum acutatum species complex TaxID=2707335 RepID=A0A010RSJ3_9PEZI|nr:uncharacterized protein HER10_EVM0008485 [Colletotrichum scovillei]EXF83481.1 hypothetical protein CFIO01_07958 [Colletotrichum fioriniae PJ7]KAJ3950183.1 hypothetical protein N0V96_001325 [Colletotrichum fioriniae]KAF4776740.1 hypothetical protein HER10_EVM0008485 [Colletotrichum scovillei]KAG7053604.1 hypothetical protein JMJ77_0000691 [Colletotrichum scovillei]KAG7071903.1 hypothetical protein JMJ76_0004769 [Colletotrichum scovillei]
MASDNGLPDTEDVKSSIFSKIHDYGTNPLPPAIHAILIGALHGRPLKILPASFAPALLFSSYVNLAGFPTDSAGFTCALSGLYALLALRRRQPLRSKFTARGLVRGTAIGMGFANSAAGAWVYANGDRKKDEVERKERNRWGGES